MTATDEHSGEASWFLIDALRHPHCQRVVAVWGSLAAAVPLLAVLTTDLGPGIVLLCMTAGWIAWSLIEYALHRHAMHWSPEDPSLRRLRETVLPHQNHHDRPNAAHLIVMRKQQIPLALIVTGAALLGLVMPLHVAAVLMAGVGLGYMLYELVHFSIHQCSPSSRMARRLKQHHLHHHFRNETVNFGVTTPLWDHVFGTHYRYGDRRRSGLD